MLALVKLIVLSLIPSAEANCIIAEPQPSEKIQVLETWKARHVQEGLLDGCILKTQSQDKSKSYAYTSYGFICDLKQNESIEVHRQSACCDSGDVGDFVCGVKPVNSLTGVPQISTSLLPAVPDKRAIPNLMQSFQKSGFRAENIATRLIEYSKFPELKIEILKHLPRLKELFRDSNSPELKAAIAKLLLQVESPPGDEVDLNLAVLNSPFFSLDFRTQNALGVLTRHPESAEKAVPTLINILRRSYKSKDREVVMSALVSFKTIVQPFLSQIHYILREDLEKKLVSTQSLWDELVCAAVPLAEGSKVSRVFWGGHEKIDPVECPFSGVSARVSFDIKENPNIPDGSGVRAWIYDLSQDKWTQVDNKNAPPIYQFGGDPAWWEAISTKSKLILWGSKSEVLKVQTVEPPSLNESTQEKMRVRAAPYTLKASGGILDISTGQWQQLPNKDVPDARSGFQMMSTDDGAVVWGGDIGIFNGQIPVKSTTDGAVFSLQKNKWTSIPEIQTNLNLNWSSAFWVSPSTFWALGYWISRAPSAQWGERGGIFDIHRGKWEEIPVDTGSNMPNQFPHLFWMGKELVAWGPRNLGGKCQTVGSRYLPNLKKWQSLSPFSISCEKTGAAWTGTHLLVWDGSIQGGLYDPKSDSWNRINNDGIPTPQDGQTIVWARDKLIVWPAGIFDPKTNSWEKLGDLISSETRLSPRMVTMGTKLFVFGGYSERGGSQPLNTGGVYDLKTKVWKKISMKNAPSLREYAGIPKLFAAGDKIILIDAGSRAQ